MVSNYVINRYTFSDGSAVELEDRVTPLNEVSVEHRYLSCMINITPSQNGHFQGDTCFVRVEFTHPENWESYRQLLNEMMSSVMGQKALCAYVEIVQASESAVTVKHTDGTLGLIPIIPTTSVGNMTRH